MYQRHDITTLDPKGRKAQYRKGQKGRKNRKGKKGKEDREGEKIGEGHYGYNINLVVRENSGYEASILGKYFI